MVSCFCRPAYILVALVVLPMTSACAQSSPGEPATAPVTNKQLTSIGDSLRRPGNEPIHLVYIHGIGATETDDSSSLRISICKALGDCLIKGGEPNGREYADQGAFDPKSDQVPDVMYMGKPIWKSKVEWMAAAPFVDHYLIRLKRGKSILLDEINWWPMVFSLKCRNMLPNETQLAGHDGTYLALCAKNQPHVGDGVLGRFDYYGWLTPAEAASYTAAGNHAVVLNRKLKVDLMDWRFSDAVLGVGPLESYLVEATRQLLMKSVSKASLTTAEVTSKEPVLLDPNAEYVIISHSLGSFLIFAALHINGQYSDTAGDNDSHRLLVFNYLLGHLTQVYFFANQIPLLELAKLGSTNASKRFLDLKDWADQRRLAISQGAPNSQPLAQIVSWSDPNDLLTWYLGQDFQTWQAADSNGVQVANRIVKNAFHWFGILEAPTSAHDNYAVNREVIRSLITPLQP